MPVDKAEPGEEFQLEHVVKKHHKRLLSAGVRIGLEFASKDGGGAAILQGGMAVPARAIITGSNARRWGAPDGIIRFDRGIWESKSGKERSAYLDHYLTAFELVTDTNGSVATDKLGRPKLKRRPYDFSVAGYDEVIARHGMDLAPEARAIREAAGTFKQLTLAFAAGPIEPPDPDAADDSEAA